MGISRSENMRRIRSKDTRPELAVRKLLRGLGLAGYRIHRKDLPGKPDVAFVGRKKAVMVHGCFWHGHDCKEGLREPKSGRGYWLPKIEGNRQRDEKHLAGLAGMEWNVLTVWECEVRDSATLTQKLAAFLGTHQRAHGGTARRPLRQTYGNTARRQVWPLCTRTRLRMAAV